MIPELRPRGIGEMLDAAVTLYRARFKSLMFVSAIVVIPVQILSSLVLLSARPDDFGFSSFGTAGPQYNESDLALQLGAFFTVFVVQVASTAFVVAACTRIVADAYIDQTATSKQALGVVSRRFFALIAVSFIVAIAQFVGTFVCFVGTFVPMAFFVVAVPALILERVGVGLSIGRSCNLVKSHFWLTLGLVVTAQVLTTVVTLGLSATAELVIRGDSSSTGSIIAQGVATAVAALITTAFVATTTVVLYFDLRIREEAFDVQLMMQRDDARLRDHVSPMFLAAVDPEEARRNAEEILNDRRFQSDPAPRPFRGALQWIGDRLEPIWSWFADVLGRVPGLVWILLGVLGLVALVTYVLLKVRTAARVAGREHGGAFAGTGERAEDPDALDREADDAERNGDLDRVVRLRFRAGLIRLGKRGAITYRPSVTTGEVRQVLGSETFDELARTFDEVTYGGTEAQQPDVAAARHDWRRVLDETKHR